MLTPYAAPGHVRRPEAFALARTPACGHASAGTGIDVPLVSDRATAGRDPCASRRDDDLTDCVARAPTLDALDAMTRLVWARWSAGSLGDDAAQTLAALAAARRAALKGQGAAHAPRAQPPRSRFPAPRKPLRPDRAASRARRRLLAASGVMPPALAARFSTGELAALKIVADEIAARGDCRLPLGAVAARAGVSETTARNALRAARRDGLLTVEQRPRRGLPSLTNIVRIVSREWLDWIARRRAGGGCKKPQGTDRESQFNVAAQDREATDCTAPPSRQRRRGRR